MMINNTQTPNFRAKFVASTQVKKLNTLKNEYEKCAVSFLEFDPANKKDLKAIKDVSRYWCDSRFGWDVFQSADAITYGNLDREANKVYILTKQKNDFDNLRYDDVLGLADVETNQNKEGKDYLNLHRLQTNPDFIDKERPMFKYIGTSILNILKGFNKIIELNSVSSAIDFYEKNGFVDLGTQFLRFRWTPEVKK